MRILLLYLCRDYGWTRYSGWTQKYWCLGAFVSFTVLTVAVCDSKYEDLLESLAGLAYWDSELSTCNYHPMQAMGFRIQGITALSLRSQGRGLQVLFFLHTVSYQLLSFPYSFPLCLSLIAPPLISYLPPAKLYFSCSAGPLSVCQDF